jgi:UDP-GlcNAc:undecaprenyl-phosphate GlcNAc-1-phosphate transferase
MSRIDAAVIAFLVTIVSILVLRPIAHSIGLVDRPGGRKQHDGIVPVIGGVCMFLGVATALLLVEPTPFGQTPFLLAAGLLVGVGAIDDRYDVSPRVRLVAQCTAALILCLGAGVTVHSLGDIFFLGDIRLGPFAIPFTVLVVMTVVNAFNFLDGMDGLAGGVALASMVLGAGAALIFDSQAGLTLAMVSIAVLLAFLIFNVPARLNKPVRTFMGDAGATLLGLMVAWVGLRLTAGDSPVVSPVTALWMAAVPIFDLFISFTRRISRGQNPMTADREHFHHILQRAGLSTREVMFAMVLASLSVGATGIFAHHAGVPDGVLFMGLLGLYTVQHLLTRRAWRLQRWIGERRRSYIAPN